MLIDTSGLLCCHHRGEPQHADAVALFKTARQRLIHNYILAEFIPLCRVRGLNMKAVLDFMVDLLDNPHVEVVWVDRRLHQSAID